MLKLEYFIITSNEVFSKAFVLETPILLQVGRGQLSSYQVYYGWPND